MFQARELGLPRPLCPIVLHLLKGSQEEEEEEGVGGGRQEPKESYIS